MNIEEFSKLAIANNDLIKALDIVLSEYNYEYESGDIEELKFLFDSVDYALLEKIPLEWVSDGKYDNGNVTYQLVSYDKTIKSYPCERNIINRYNVLVEQSMYRTGSYYSDYYITYEEPCISIAYKFVVPEVTIPAHSEVGYKGWIKK